MFKIFQNTILVLILGISCGSENPQDILISSPKINGVSFVASNNEVFDSTIAPVVAVNANWAALSPFGFMQAKDSPELRFNETWQWWGEKIEGVEKTARIFKSRGIQIMLKPQIWIRRGEFTGLIQMKSEEDWKTFEKEYEEFIIPFAKVAEKEQIPLFCIGTELNLFVTERPDFWKQLIQKIRNVYSGKLTYASNWDSYKNPAFWKQLDFIGVDAYFPLTNEKTPSVENLKKAWNTYKTELNSFSKSNQKTIIFTEFGYRSIDFTANQPWDSNVSGDYNVLAQENALQAIFETFWNEAWFGGGFLWKWFDNSDAGGIGHTGFTVQNKESQTLVKTFYAI